MKLDAATLGFATGFIALLLALYLIAADNRQDAGIKRLEVAARSLCGPNSPNHHSAACAEMSKKLSVAPSPLNALLPDTN